MNISCLYHFYVGNTDLEAFIFSLSVMSCKHSLVSAHNVMLYMKSRSVNKEVSFPGIPKFGSVMAVLTTKSTTRRNENSFCQICQTLGLMLKIQFCSINPYAATGIQVETPEKYLMCC